MIYLVTGTPGAGKSLYAISTLVQELMCRALKRKGQIVPRRLLVDGVTGLVIPHEKLAPGVEADDGSLQPGEGQGIWNWWEWCQPGDVIFVDEVQRWFRPRGLGVKVPPEIKHLETHRHLGVDFVFVTQSPMLLDQNIRRLVYRHQHIRRLWGMQRAMIYEWDGCAENVKSTKAATMRQWGYPRSAYALYQSSELHTKPKVRVPIWALLPIVAAIGAVFLAPTVFATMQSAMTGKGLIPQQAQAKPATPPAPSMPLPPVPAPMPAPGLALSSTATDAPKPSGCILTPGGVCKCMDTEGGRMDMDVEMCRDLATPGRKVVDQPAIAELPLARVVTPEEMDLYQFIAKQKGPATRSQGASVGLSWPVNSGAPGT